MKVKQYLNITGGLSKPSKMPGYSWSIPATKCKTGSKLREKEGSVCRGCYARKGRYMFNNVKKAQSKRLSGLEHPLWVEAMVFLVNRYSSTSGVFRWFDSGDLQSIQHLKNIVKIARRTPNIKHWLPTKETRLVKLAISKGVRIPGNLIIRHSVHMVGEKPGDLLKRLTTSTVDADYGYKCPVKSGTETCNTHKCRACWNKSIKNVDYRSH